MYDGPRGKTGKLAHAMFVTAIETLTTEQHERQWLPEGTAPASTKATGAGGASSSKKSKKKKKR